MASNAKAPAILALQNADAGLMSFAHVDMSRCIFYGAHALGSVVIEPSVKFANTPRWFYTKRHCIADELAWRYHASGYRSWGWKLPGVRVTEDEEEADERRDALDLPVVRASQVAATYRDLRRSFEAKSDEPGAADFYYGEMEMRRHSREAGFAEQSIIWLYWISAGYGLRASRAFAWLLALVVGGGITMAHVGFVQEKAGYVDSFIFSIQAAFRLFRSTRDLNQIGELIAIALGLLGPVLFALWLLALRGRVKR